MRRRSLWVRISLYVTLAVFGLLGLAIVYGYLTTRQSSRDLVRDRAEAVADEIGFTFEVLTKYDDNFALRRVVEQTGTIPGVLQVGITDRDGRYLVHDKPDQVGQLAAEPLVPQVIAAETRMTRFDDNRFVVVQPLHGPQYLSQFHSDVLGAIVIYADVSAIDAQQFELFSRGALATLGLLVLMAAGLMWFLNRQIVRPIRRLALATRQVAAGDLTTRVEPQTEDEIGDLTRSFNRMADELCEREAAVQRAKEELEDRVARRTADLSHANSSLQAEIAERQHMEAVLRESAERFRTLFEASPDAILLIEPSGAWPIIDCNSVACQLNGYTREELVGQSIDVLNLTPGDDAERAAYLDRLRQCGPVHLKTMHRRKDGTPIPIEVSTALITLDGREVVLGIDRDITERERAEAELSAANAELARAARTKDEFLANMSHELRTPLNSILGLSEVLREEVYGSLNDKQVEVIRGVEESGRHLLSLINDILDLAKIEAGRMDCDPQPVPVEALVQASIRLIKQAAQQKQLQVLLSCDSRVTTIQADPRRLKQILVNLLSNAVKFTPAGGQVGLEVQGDSESQSVQFAVWDTGIGIAPEDLRRLFKPFVQVDSSLSRQHAGTGLGLALVSRLIDMHGGSISVQSQVGQGSRFTVSLPWQPPINATATAVAAPAPTARLPVLRRVFLIEDSADAAEQMARYFREWGVETIVHSRGVDAVSRALEVLPDLICLDMLLPDVSGWDVLAQLRAERRLHDVPILVTSVTDDRPRGLAAGAADWLVKPVSRQQLQQAIAAIWGPNTQTIPQSTLASQPDSDVPARQPLVLLADDNPQNIQMFSDYLQVKGYRVIVARDGDEAVMRTLTERPAVVLMDIQMPGTDGLEAIRRIRANAAMASTPIVALTALAMPEDRARCLAAGANDYLSKPVSMNGLVRAIQAQLN